MKVRWNSNAYRELAEVLAYLSGKNPNAAITFTVQVRSAEKRISDFPTIGRPIDLPNARRVLVGSYILVYELMGEEAVISYLRHGSRKRPWEPD